MEHLFRPLSAALVASATCLWGSAFADWQGTVWNSPVEQADKDFSVPHRPPTPAEIQNWSGEIKIAFDYTTGDLAFHKGALLFKDGKLYMISMSLKDPTQCDKLIEILRRTYGTPAKEEPPALNSTKLPELNLGSAHLITWYDERHHNQVNLSYRKYNPPTIEDDCDLKYQPFIVPAPGQL